MKSWLVIVFICLFTSIASAEAVISLPLDGYYRPGKFFPVTVTSDQPVAVQIDVDGGVGSRGSGTAVTLPVMLLSNTSRSLRVLVDGKPTDLPIRPLAENERLALAGSSTLLARASSLFPGQLVVSAVAPIDRIGRLGLAYESADVVLWPGTGVDAAAVSQIESTPFGGPMLAIPGNAPVAVTSFFHPRGGWNVMELQPRGPTDSLDNSAAYDAMSGFNAARSATARRGIWLGSAVFAILALGASLLGRRSVYVVVAIAFAWCAAGAIYFGRQSPISQHVATIRVRTPAGGLEQEDRWTVRTSLQNQPDEFASGGANTRPIFAGHAGVLGTWIELTPANWRYHYTLQRGGKIAFVERGWALPGSEPRGEIASDNINFSNDLARQIYRRPGDVVDSIASQSDSVIVHPKP